MKDVLHNAERFLMVRFAHITYMFTYTHGQLALKEKNTLSTYN